MKKEEDVKEKLIRTAAEMLEEGTEVDKITVRQIAGRSQTGIGLINYHFGSRDNLLNHAIARIMEKRLGDFREEADKSSGAQPKERLKRIVKTMYEIGAEHEGLIRFAMLQCIREGDMGAELSLVPFLRDIFREKGEGELRLLALQIIAPIQVSGISFGAFMEYEGVDLYDREQRCRFIDRLIDNLIREEGTWN